jgi:hypothetical protein
VTWMVDGEPKIFSSSGYAGISHCVVCDTSSTDNAGCKIVPVPVQAECCQLGTEPTTNVGLCGTGWSYSNCDVPLQTSRSTNLIVSAHQSLRKIEGAPRKMEVKRVIHQTRHDNYL